MGADEPTKTAAQLIREIAERDPEAHAAALARGYGSDRDPAHYANVPGPPWFKITVETAYGACIPQTVEANNLTEALVRAAALPFLVWFPREDEDEDRTDGPRE